MKKTFLIIVLIILIPLTMIAESYSSLWKKYLYNIDNGHPQTASVVLNKIISKASLEKKYGVDLLDKMNVTFKLGEHIAHKPLIDFKKMVKEFTSIFHYDTWAWIAVFIAFLSLLSFLGYYFGFIRRKQ